MTHVEIVKKLIGQIYPVGETDEDNKRLKNLEAMCNLVDDLISDINDVAYDNKNSREYSVKRASDYANKFLDNIIEKITPEEE